MIKTIIFISLVILVTNAMHINTVKEKMKIEKLETDSLMQEIQHNQDTIINKQHQLNSIDSLINSRVSEIESIIREVGNETP